MRKYSKDDPRSICKTLSLIEALKIMDSTDVKSLLVVDDNYEFTGVLSIGDIQRAIISSLPLSTKVHEVLRKNPRIATENTSIDTIKAEMIMHRMEFMPVIDSKRVIGMYFWEDLFLDKNLPPKSQFDLPVVIMAGGNGKRLRPLTNVIPKPLIPIGEKTILEEIISGFKKFGCKDFFLTTNYKAELLRYYLENVELGVKLQFIRESEPLGTAGSLSLIREKINGTFFVTNCDILIDQDYSEVLDFHRVNSNDITLIAALKHYPIAYGTLETGEDGLLLGLSEKPEITLKINTGMYIIEPQVLNKIPENTFYHITELIESVRLSGGRVGVFPVSEKSWTDIGTWSDLLKLYPH